MSITLVPRPKNVVFSDSPPVQIKPGSAAMVIGDAATQPEQYAAELLQQSIQRRHAQKWPILRESEVDSRFSVVVHMGQQCTCKCVNDYALKLDMDLSEKKPGLDGYSIRMEEAAGRLAVIVGGSNDRAVIYGGDTLFQLLTQQDSDLVLHRACIDDWASIPWRGRPQSSNPGHFVPGRFESYARARMNWTDLRNGTRSGQYGYPPGHKLDVDEVNRVLTEAHRRGMFVYATVDCAVRPKDFDAAIGTFEELVSLGADGLYISIDDPGAEFRFGTSDELIKRVLDLGRKHDMTGRKIGIVPGKESYPKVLTDVNRRVAKIPGMEQALWFFTVTPSAQELEDAQTIGLKVMPCWWHNWPRPERGGLTFGAYGGSIRANGKHCYMEPPTLAEGWGKASFGDLAHAAEHIEAVMPWGGSEWGAEYNSSILGWWAWAPELCDWKAMRTRMYDIVFGPSQIEAAFDFDDSLAKLRNFFTTQDRKGPRGQVPALANPANRDAVANMAARMRGLLGNIASGARSQSFVPADVLEDYYLEPMAAAVDNAEALSLLDFPEYWWPLHEERVRLAAREGRCEQVAEWNKAAREKVASEVEHIREVLKDKLAGMDDYVARWNAGFDPTPVIPVLETGPRVTGQMSDAIWQQGLRVENFALGRNTPPDPTEAFLLATETDLFIGFVCHEQRMPSLRVSHTGRDSEVWLDDSVEIFLNPDMLGAAVYQIVVSAAGEFMDSRGSGGVPGSPDWNADVEVKAAMASDRWTAEIRIPLRDLDVAPNPGGQMWRMNLARNDFAGPFSGLETDNACEVSSWSGQGRFHDASLMKPVVFGE